MSIERRSRVEQGADHRRRILDAALATFTERGYHPTTLDRIALAAGFTKGAVYSRFASKADLFLELYAERIDARVAQIAALPPSGERVAENLVRQWLGALAGQRAWALLVIEFRAQAARDPACNARLAEIHHRLVRAVADVIARDVAAAGLSLQVPALEVARAGLAFATGTLLAQVNDPDELGDDTVASLHAALFRAFLVGGTP